ncbi:MAG: S9 family peptidase [Phycisphaerae bacterium]
MFPTLNQQPGKRTMPKTRPMKLEDLFKLKAVGRVAFSPDRTRIVFELKRFDLADNRNYQQLMLLDAHTGAVRPLTQGQHVDSAPKWSPDGERLAFLSDREKATAVYVLHMAGGEPQRITDRDGNVRDLDWSPDGRRLAYSYQPMNAREKLERDGKHDEVKKQAQFKHYTRVFHKLDGAGWWNGQYAHIHVVSAGGGKTRQLTHGEFDDNEPRFSPDGRLVSFLSNRVENPDLNCENMDIWSVPAGGGKARQLKKTRGGCAGHAWSPNGKWIAFVGNAAKQGESWRHNDGVWVISRDGGKPRLLTRRIDSDCRNVTLGDIAGISFDTVAPIWTRDGQRLFFLVSERGACRLFSCGVERGKARCEVGGDVNIYAAHRAAADGPIALSLGTQTNPGDAFVFDPRDGQPPRQLTSVNADELARIDVLSPEPFSVKSDGVTIDGWILKPPGFNPRKKYPAILEIHGGPAGQYGFAMFHEMQWLAGKGYVVCYSNPRGSAGYGLKFRSAIRADWGNRDYRDLMRVADWLFARPFVDRKRVGVTGGSYGGYMTNWIIGHTDRFKAAATQRSVVNFESMCGTSDYGFDFGHELGGTPWKNVERLRRQSPLTYVKNIRTPLLIEHEEQDHRCPIEQAEQLFTALKMLGQEVEFVRFEGESHGLSRGGRPQNRAERLRRIGSWFDRHL